MYNINTFSYETKVLMFGTVSIMFRQVLIASIVIAVMIKSSYASPIDSCLSQSQCLQVDISSCDSQLKRTVCMSWNPSSLCAKSDDPFTNQTVSHACVASENKTENWEANDVVCTSVTGGENAVFGVKDGSDCSLSDNYPVYGSSALATCSGPHEVCDGHNDKECRWTFPTDVCETTTTTTTTPPPTTTSTVPPTTTPCEPLMCTVTIPCRDVPDTCS